ncbi:MAG: hypothetical protein LBF97_08100 [Elusimicrobiota bacterium]|jgi:hypothetical protein|nr:hypothetical protein [Elusimicrobiota bacterium]
MNNIPRNIEFYINIFYEYEENNIKQVFQFISQKKNFKYVFDKRYCLKEKVDRLLNNENKTCNEIEFVRRIDYDDKIELIYNSDCCYKFKGCIKNLSFYLPPNNCLYCEHNKKDGDFIFCDEKKKHYQVPIKTCKIFRAKIEVIT